MRWNFNPELIRIYVGYDGIIIQINVKAYKPNWLKTKDLHPRKEDFEKIIDYIYSINKKDRMHEAIVIDIKKYENEKIKDLYKINDEDLFDILIEEYINSTEGYEFFLNYIINELNGKKI